MVQSLRPLQKKCFPNVDHVLSGTVTFFKNRHTGENLSLYSLDTADIFPIHNRRIHDRGSEALQPLDRQSISFTLLL